MELANANFYDAIRAVLYGNALSHKPAHWALESAEKKFWDEMQRGASVRDTLFGALTLIQVSSDLEKERLWEVFKEAAFSRTEPKKLVFD